MNRTAWIFLDATAYTFNDLLHGRLHADLGSIYLINNLDSTPFTLEHCKLVKPVMGCLKLVSQVVTQLRYVDYIASKNGDLRS